MRSLVFATLLFTTVFAVASFADWTTPVPVAGINTSNSEGGPWLSNDGLTIYFNRWTDHSRLYQATRSSIDSPFTSVTPITELNSSTQNTSYAWVSQDGLRMYYTQDRQLRLASRTSTGSSWVAGSYVNELNSYGNQNVDECGLSANECTIVFETAGANGKWEMNIASRSDTGSPFGNIRLLSELDTPYNDCGASLSADGLSIFFASDRSGSWNIYEATRGNVNDSFGAPITISSLAGFAQPTISMDGKTMLLVSTGDDSSTWDIYVSTIPEPATIALFGLGIMALRSRRKSS